MQRKPLILAVVGFFLAAAPLYAAQKQPHAAAVIDDGYAGAILKKIVNTGKLKFNRSLELRLSLDDRGQLIECRASNQAEAQEACAAAKAAAPFGTPPYGVPTFVTLALWTQQPGAKTAPAENQNQGAAAKADGKAKQASEAYIRKVTRELRNSMYIPAEAKPGTYHVTVLVHINGKGQVLDSSIVKGSGDRLVDKYCLQGIKRAGRISAPPAGFGDNLELEFTLTR